MSKELATRTTSSTVEMARLMADSTLLPRAYQKQPANLLFAFELADSIGIPRINALTSIHVIDGKPTASADLIAALVRRAGHKLRVEGDDTYAEATIIRADDPEYVPTPIRWDAAKAKRAGKWGSKGPWSQYPAAMLRSRAITEAARMWASDALYGVIYTPEELGTVVDEDGTPVQQQRPVDRLAQAAAQPLDPDAFLDQVEATTDVDALRVLWQHAADLPAERVEDARAIIQARVETLTTAPAEQEQPAEDAAEPTLDAEIVEEATA